MMFCSRLLFPLLAMSAASAFQVIHLEEEPTRPTSRNSVMQSGLGLHRPDPIGASRSVSTRIVGGTNAPAGRYPYYTFVEISTDNGIFICSATLIWEDVLLTAAHCILDLEEAGLTLLGVNAFVGLENQNNRDQAEFRQVELFVPNPNYNTITQERDVAIFKLVDPVLNIQPVQLGFDPSIPVDNQRVDVFGFGETSDGGSVPDQLQTVNIQVIPFADCNDANSFNGFINDALMVCAGRPGGGADSCNGDSGSPLIVPGTDFRTDVVVGLVSFGQGCATADFPGVYTRISSVGNFIFNQICGFSDNPPTNCADIGSPVLSPPSGGVTPSPVFPSAPIAPSPIAPSPTGFGGDDDDDDDDDSGKGGGKGGKKGGKGMGGGGMMGMSKRRELETRDEQTDFTRGKTVRGL